MTKKPPNYQQIPQKTEEVKAIRKAFLGEETLVEVDYSKIEERVLPSNHSPIDDLFALLNKHNVSDIHLARAMEEIGITDPKKVTKEMRQKAKQMNYNEWYGIVTRDEE